ncbi:26S proteasome non-ATPase regulatory subunit 5 [Fimicolochytrium jonesii]|uniref:26S proteasome non-ATPase regulatory subunit 5 n=1 Tax=Fimicolochytrium jonesii TaxID=1396493 RepID=UPI0022FF3F4F|nr:26S proteasome non-ATPase regulatory subunit 5 [Fimicolochytrium jonesii]KAI8825945.1 26S proteasome non-ATPase regulatory subunit 5 [Fimicolochytrium jonesii]
MTTADPAAPSSSSSSSSSTNHPAHALHDALALLSDPTATPESLSAALQTIHLALEGRNARDVTAFMQTYDVTPAPFVALLGRATTEDAVGMVARIVERLLVPLTFGEVVRDYQPLVLQGLSSPSGSARKLALAALEKAAGDPKDVDALVHSEFFAPLLECIAFPDVDVALRVQALIFELALTPPGLASLTDPSTVALLTRLTHHTTETTKFRVYDLCVRIASTSPQALDACLRAGVLKDLLEELQVEGDVLGRLNVVQVFTRFLDTDPGVTFMGNTPVLSQLASLLDGEMEEIDDVLVGCAVVKFFAEMAAKRPSEFLTFATSHPLLATLTRHLTPSSPTQTALPLATLTLLANLGATPAGLLHLHREHAFLDHYLALAPPATGELKLAVLQAASCLVGCTPPPDADAGVLTDLTHAIFLRVLAASPEAPPPHLARLLPYARSAFVDQRVAACALFAAAAAHAWGVTEANADAEFVRWLLERQGEAETVVKEWKYAIIKRLNTHPLAGQLLAPDLRARFGTYIAQGPFYRAVEPVVAFGGA